MAKEYFWGGKLTEKEKSLKWDPEREYADDDDSQNDDITHYLFLKQAVLGAEAKEGERNIVEVQTANFDGDIITQPLLSLKVGLNESTQLDIGLQPPVTFKLVGTGPVYLTGQHALELEHDDDFDDDSDDFKDDSYLLGNEAEEGEEDDEEDDDEDDEEEDEEEDELDVSLEKKQVAGAKDKKKTEASKKEIKKDNKVDAQTAGKGKKRPAPSSSGAAKKLAKLEKDGKSKKKSSTSDKAENGDAEEDDDDEEDDEDEDDEDLSVEEEEEEEDENEDEKEMALGDDDEDEDGDSDDDDEDEEMDEDEEDEEESSSPPEKPAKKTKGKVNGTTKSKEAPKQAQEKQKGKKEKKMTYSVDDVKADLLKSPSKPKKEEKFTNFVKSRYHMTDSKKVQELWGWYKRTQLK